MGQFAMGRAKLAGLLIDAVLTVVGGVLLEAVVELDVELNMVDQFFAEQES